MEPLADEVTGALEPAKPATRHRRKAGTAVGALVEALEELGVEEAFGVSGGGVALLFDALVESKIRLRHFRHESGAAFAAIEAHFASQRPVAIFATTGPGILNALTGLTAARWDGAKVILVTGATGAAQRGRWAIQETSSYTLAEDALYTRGPIFDFAVRLERPVELREVLSRLRSGVARVGGFVAHVAMPVSVQPSRVEGLEPAPPAARMAPAAEPRQVAAVAQRLLQGPFAVWLGFGAVRAAASVRELVERSGAACFCSPRAKGVVPEDHPQFLGVTGLGGHRRVRDYMIQHRPRWVLVLGSRLGEATSFWDRDLEPQEGFLHVDLDAEVPGTAYPDVYTLGIQAEIGAFLAALVEYFPERRGAAVGRERPIDAAEGLPVRIAGRSPVRPQILMAEIQHRIVEATDAPVLSESGNAFAWCNHHLRFATAGRYRTSSLFGSMGHMAAGVVGAALARQGKAVAVVGDGSMLMNNELSTAVHYRAPAVWVVLNDGGYGMCRDGHEVLGLTDRGVDFPPVDFLRMARSLGAEGRRVTSEDQLGDALELALRATGPFLVDVQVDRREKSPLLARFESLMRQGSSKQVAGWQT